MKLNNFFFLSLLLTSINSIIAHVQNQAPRLVERDSNATSISAYNYTTDAKIQGVALGGWFVLEPYITPSLFESFSSYGNGSIPVDEYHYCSYLGKDEAHSRLDNHWDTFYNETDFQLIKQYGLNMVRIPIGYWAFKLMDDDPYVQGQEFYLDRAIGWSKDNGLNVWIDLHGVPGSQNGFDNSGLRDHLDWQNHSANINATFEVLTYIFDKYGQSNYSDTVIGIEVVNEPLGPKLNMTQLQDFYAKSYDLMRDGSNSTNDIVFQDAFQSIGYWDSFLSNDTSKYYNMVIDHHHYEVFTVSQLNSSIEQHLSNVKNLGSSISKEAKPGIVGEWSAALTDCVPWLNGVGTGARYNGSFENDISIGTCKNITNIKKWGHTLKENTRKFVEVQLDSYTSAGGWIFWCWKTETTIDWDFQRLVENGLMPQPLTDRRYDSNGNKLSNATSEAGSIVFRRVFSKNSYFLFAQCLILAFIF